MENNEISAQILDAAKARFNFYGYRKTTMAEVAGDCGMSAANLYRYFESKLEICAALARGCLAEKETLLEQVVNDTAMTAQDKLPVFILKMLHHTYHYFESAPKLGELVEVMTVQRPDIIAEHRHKKLALLTALLLQGEATGEFVFDDVNEAADAVHSAILLFYYPLTMSLYPLSILEKKAKHVSQLLLCGLRPNNRTVRGGL
jgi:AcrR family transcriptional regulator